MRFYKTWSKQKSELVGNNYHIHFSCGRTGNELEKRLASDEAWYESDPDETSNAPCLNFPAVFIGGILEGPNKKIIFD